MKTATEKSHPPAKIGDDVTITIPDVDKVKGDIQNTIKSGSREKRQDWNRR